MGGKSFIACHPEAPRRVKVGEKAHRLRISGIGSSTDPAQRLLGILCNAFAEKKHETKVVLGLGMASACGTRVPTSCAHLVSDTEGLAVVTRCQDCAQTVARIHIAEQ